MVTWLHCGLYFTPTHVLEAKKYAKREPFKAAWETLHQPPVPELIPSTLWNSLRFRFDGDVEAGRKAVDNLLHDPEQILDPGNAYLDQVMVLLTWAQCFELVRDHSAFTPREQEAWMNIFAAQMMPLIQGAAGELLPVERIWQALLMLAAGIVLENEIMLQQGADYYRTVIDHDVRPEGYLPSVVEGHSSHGSAMLRLLLSVKGLVLMAAAAQTMGIDLWHYHNRGVSIVTAGLYPMYYYFYPEKWQWEAGLDQPEVERLFRLHGSWIEPLNHHIQQPTRAIDLILKDLRPVIDIWGGGILTLSHGVPARRGLFG